MLRVCEARHDLHGLTSLRDIPCIFAADGIENGIEDGIEDGIEREAVVCLILSEVLGS